MIKIGVSACFLYPDPNRSVFGPKTLSYVEHDLIRYLARPGVLPVLIPDVAPGLLKSYLAEMDGVVFSGGSDLDPKSYGERPIQKRWPGDRYRDDYELRILDFAVNKGRPVLGVCRGCQLINVYFGGSLYQDITTQHAEALVHRDAKRYDRVQHAVTFTPGGLLDRLYRGKVPKYVNSVHHQGIKKLGKGLSVEAICPEDGLVEAVVGQDRKKFVLGVQWHPEFSAALKGKVISPKPLYDYFLKRVTG